MALRSAAPADEAFLADLHADRHRPELAALGWPEPAVREFLDLQLRAQESGYGTAFPEADHRIILEHRSPVGRLLLDRRPDEHLMIDLVVLHHCRGRGIGTVVLRTVQDEALAAGVPVRLTVRRDDRRLVGWYEALGWCADDQDDCHLSMVFRH